MKKKNVTLVLAVALMLAVHTQAAVDVKSISACLTADKKSAQSKYYYIDAQKMDCEVMSSSKYPIKYQAYGSASETSPATIYYTVTYNVNAKGTKALPQKPKYNCSSIKLSGNDVGTVKKGCIGWGKIY